MFKTRHRKVEEEAKKDPEYRPTKDLHAEGEEENDFKSNFPLGMIIAIGIIVLLIIVCVVVIQISGGPLPWNQN